MADNRTMAQLLEAPTEGYKDAIVVPEITANNFEIKQWLLYIGVRKQAIFRIGPQAFLSEINATELQTSKIVIRFIAEAHDTKLRHN
ncbi:hypothetical protein Tco_1456624 [Tanacetum coccineum]